jgi:hypothetical protein
MKTVLVRLPHRLVIEHEGRVVTLECGINDTAPADLVERWLSRHSTLACVKRGDVCIAEDGRADRRPTNVSNVRPRKTA